MKILKPKKVVKTVEQKAEVKPKQKRVSDEDEYPDLITPLELELTEKDKLVFSVARGGEYGLPIVDIRHYVNTSKYTGATKKGIRIPLELLYSFNEVLEELDLACEEVGVER